VTSDGVGSHALDCREQILHGLVCIGLDGSCCQFFDLIDTQGNFETHQFALDPIDPSVGGQERVRVEGRPEGLHDPVIRA
jgi:hypothetical protein